MSEMNISPDSPRRDNTTKKHQDKLSSSKYQDNLRFFLNKDRADHADDRSKPSSNKKPLWTLKENRWVKAPLPSTDPKSTPSQPLPSSPTPYSPAQPSVPTSSTSDPAVIYHLPPQPLSSSPSLPLSPPIPSSPTQLSSPTQPSFSIPSSPIQLPSPTSSSPAQPLSWRQSLSSLLGFRKGPSGPNAQPNKLRAKFPPSDRLELPEKIFSGSVQELANIMNEERRLKTVIKQRNDNIHKKMINFEEKIKKYEPQNKNTRDEIINISNEGQLTPAGGGGGAYKLIDKNGNPRFIIKPNDQDSRCLNNEKGLANPFIEGETDLNLNDIRNRPDIPLYESVQNEALAYDLACVTGLEKITPRTIAVTLENREFYCMTDGFNESLRNELQNKVNNPKKKLCSAQEYIPGKDLDKLDDHVKEEIKKNKHAISYEIDKDDYEMANIFTWLTGSLDSHMGNYLFFEDNEKSTPNHKIMRLKKIDNGLTCGDGDKELIIENGLQPYKKSEQLTPIGQQLVERMNAPLSENGQNIILNIKIEDIKKKMHFWEKSPKSIDWTIYRIQVMQTLVKDAQNKPRKPDGSLDLTLNQINKIIEVLSRLPPEKRALVDPKNIAHLNFEDLKNLSKGS